VVSGCSVVMRIHKGGLAVKLRQDIRGMTLIETMVAVAILAIVAVILVTGFFSAGIFFNRSTDAKNAGQNSAAVLEGAQQNLYPDVVKTEDEAGLIRFVLNGVEFNIGGTYTKAYEKGFPDINLRIFTPNSYTP
jgi:prepilin-type N-terminal cleavage/methylation domain-containing protein